MSADASLMQDDAQMTRNASLIVGDEALLRPFERDNSEQELPLNAEEATILVLHFLERMKKRIVSPRKAVLNENNIYVVDVDLKEATATIHIHPETREIIEYTITERPKEVMPLPIPPRRIVLVLGIVIAMVITAMTYNFLILYAKSILNAVHSDYLLVGGAALVVAAGIVWWRRRY